MDMDRRRVGRRGLGGLMGMRRVGRGRMIGIGGVIVRARRIGEVIGDGVMERITMRTAGSQPGGRIVGRELRDISITKTARGLA